MSLPLAATTEEVEASRAWIRDFYKGINSSDINSWIIKFYQPDAILNLRNLPELKGHKEIASSFENERAKFSSTKHDIIHVDVFSDRIYIQEKDTFIVKNDLEQKEITIKTVVVIK